MEALWATILFSGFALEVIIRQGESYGDQEKRGNFKN
jgi:hypothetical protein